MIKFFIVRILGPLIAILLVRSLIVAVWKGIAQAFQPPQQKKTAQTQDVPTGGELKKDPVCGTYVSPGASVTKRVNGELVHFCSTECRDKFKAA